MPREKKNTTPAGKKANRKPTVRRAKQDPQIPGPADAPDAPLGYHILASARAYTHALHAELAAKPSTRTMTVPQLQTMQIIAANDGIIGSDIARALNITPQSVTTILNSLSSRGWIQRTAAPGKGRAMPTRLTASGRAQMNKGVAALARVDEKLADTYSHDGAEAAVLADLLRLGRLTFTGSQAA